MNNKLIQVILPIYNEEENLMILIDKLLSVKSQLGLNLKFIFINDGSTDNSEQIILRSFNSEIMEYVKSSYNHGYSHAVIKGIELCQDEGHILIFDTDNQFDFSQLNLFIPYAYDFDIVLGNRFPRVDNPLRVLLGKIWTWIGRILFNTEPDDLNCGFKLFRSEILKKMKIDSCGPGINLEIFSDPEVIKLSKKQINVKHFARKSGNATGSSIKTLILSVKDLLMIFNKRFIKLK